MPGIHPTAIIDRAAEIAADAQIGPYVVIEGRVTIGPGSHVGPHSILRGRTIIGASCKIGPGAHVGLDPQHLGYDGKETSLFIGAGTIIREGASIHRSLKSSPDHATRIGKRCFLMGGSHVAHDCTVGDDVIIANNVMLGGHVEVGDRAFIGGGCGVHQFCRLGRLAILAGNESASRDVPPFAAMRYGGLKGYNAIGCQRAGMSEESIHAIRAAFHCIHSHRTVVHAADAIRAIRPQVAELAELLEFIARSRRGIHASVHFAPHPTQRN